MQVNELYPSDYLPFAPNTQFRGPLNSMFQSWDQKKNPKDV